MNDPKTSNEMTKFYQTNGSTTNINPMCVTERKPRWATGIFSFETEYTYTISVASISIKNN